MSSSTLISRPDQVLTMREPSNHYHQLATLHTFCYKYELVYPRETQWSEEQAPFWALREKGRVWLEER